MKSNPAAKWAIAITALASLAVAQQPGGWRPPNGMKVPTPPVTNPASNQAGSSGGDSTGSISFPNSQVGDVLSYYELLTGKRIIRDNNINALTVTIFANKPMTKERAAQFIESALLLNGVALVPEGKDSLKALSTSSRKPVSEVVPLITGDEEIPDSDEVVSYFMPLQFVAPEDAKKTFESHVTLHDYGAITPAPGGAALLITENARLVRRFIELQALIDKEPSKVVTEFVQLERADASRVVQLVTDALKPPDEKGGSGGNVRPPAALGGAQKGGSESVSDNTPGWLISGALRLVPDDRTNRILVVTTPANIVLVRAMIQQFDMATTMQKPLSRTLRYIPVADAVQALTSVLNENGENSGNGQGAPGQQNIPRAIPVNPLSQNSSPSSAGGSSSGASAQPDQLSEPADSGAPISVTVGKTWIVADPRTNTILVSGPPESIVKVNLVLDRLDQKPKQVYLATVIGQLDVSHNFQFGINYLQNQTGNSAGSIGSSFFAATPAGLALQANGQLPANSILTSLNGLTVYGVISGAVSYYINALEASNRFKVLARPVVYTANNKKAEISSGEKIPVPVSTVSQLNQPTTIVGSALNSVTGNNVALASNIDYQDVLLKLEVVPLVNADGDVTLKIAQTNDNVTGSQEVSGNSIPIIGTQELNTTVTIKNGQTIVLGGLVSESVTSNYNGLPWLSRIPVLGYVFRTTTHIRERKELMIFIQPVVIDENGEAEQVTANEKVRTQIPSDVGGQLHFEDKTPGMKTLKAIHQ